MVYRILTQMAGAVLTPIGRRGPGRWRARLGDVPDAVPQGGVWLHGASVGEIASALPLAREIARTLPVYITTNTETGRNMAKAAGFPAGLAPLDLPQAVARFLDRLAPRIAVGVESEFWPNRAAALTARGVVQVLVGARISARSAARWHRLPGLITPILAGLSAASAQDAASEARLLALGLPPGAVVARANLKLMAALARPVLPQPPTRPQTLLLASTHEGEEALILPALAGLLAAPPPQHAPLRLIVAPRHPQRFDAVARLMAAQGLAFARRSQGADAGAAVLLADSMGEMDRWYAAAAMVLTGGSLVEKGGHTPWEPAAQGCALLHGPHVANFADDYALLAREGAAVAVDAGNLAAAVSRLLADPAGTAARGQSARRVLQEQAGDPARLVRQIMAFATAGDLLADRRVPMMEGPPAKGPR